MATLLPNAFPPMVSDATSAVTIKVVNKTFELNFTDIIIAIDEANAPDIIPQISPITSLQKLDTFSEFLINFTASFDPFTRFVAIELKVDISDTVTAIPIISKIIPINITNNIKNILIIAVTFDTIIPERNENPSDIKNADKVIVNTHFISTSFLLYGFFLLAFFEYFSLYIFFSIISSLIEMAINIVNFAPWGQVGFPLFLLTVTSIAVPF